MKMKISRVRIVELADKGATVELNGMPLDGICQYSVEKEPRAPQKITITLWADVEILHKNVAPNVVGPEPDYLGGT